MTESGALPSSSRGTEVSLDLVPPFFTFNLTIYQLAFAFIKDVVNPPIVTSVTLVFDDQLAGKIKELVACGRYITSHPYWESNALKINSSVLRHRLVWPPPGQKARRIRSP